VLFRDFVAALSDQLEIEGDSVTDQTLLSEVGLDSIGVYELYLIVEDLGGTPTESDIEGWRTIGDVYQSLRVPR
jgi:acyl carrier protein